MATPPAPVSSLVGQILTAPFWNTEIDAALAFILDPPAVRLHDIGGQTIGTAQTIVTFAVEDKDTDTMHDPTTNTDRITIRTNGTYAVYGGLEFGTTGATTQNRTIVLLKNNVVVDAARYVSSSAGSQSIKLPYYEYLCVVGDYFSSPGSTAHPVPSRPTRTGPPSVPAASPPDPTLRQPEEGPS